jgi:CheY-like chemotaxis protein
MKTSRKILIADDYRPHIKSLLSYLSLEFPNFQFYTASNGKNACMVYDINKPFGAAILDMAMPYKGSKAEAKTGLKVADKLKKDDPDLLIILMSGNVDQENIHLYRDSYPYLNFLEKTDIPGLENLLNFLEA